jgi:membrane protease YdiL (CAAX protease family)
MKNADSFASKIVAVAWSALLSFLILAFGQGVWGALLISNLRTSPAVPWAVLVMGPILWAMWKYLGGRWWPHRTSEARRQCLRANPVSRRTYMWTLIAGVLSIAALTGYWIVFFGLFKMRVNALPDLSKYPLMTVALVGVMASLVSPLTEEAAFRGYGLVVLERTFPAGIAITISSVLFALAHLTQGFYWPKLFVYFLAGVVFALPAYLSKSTLPTIPVHIAADLTFFALVWPRDASRNLVWQQGADLWFYLHVAQALTCTVLAILAFRRLARVTAASASSESNGGLSRVGPTIPIF